jgi:membrane-anchored glycerophosphoryl diester phosphodiesterase (GDPDase)
MYIAAVVLEDRMPVRALSRSSELTDRRWFRVFAILGIASLIIGTMLSVLGGLVTIPLTVFEAVRGQFGLNPTEAVISSAATFIIQVLLASIGSIVYTVLFIDLRNRREGTDIVERLSQLEASPLPANG